MSLTPADRLKFFPSSDTTSTTPRELSDIKTPSVSSSCAGVTLVSPVRKPIFAQISSTTSRVTPARIPLASAGVQTAPSWIQNRLLLAPSTTCPSGVQQQRLVRARRVRLRPREDLRQLVARLELRQRLVRRQSRRSRDDPPLRRPRARVVRRGVQRHHQRWMLRAFRRIPAFAHPARKRNPQQRFRHRIALDEFHRAVKQLTPTFSLAPSGGEGGVRGLCTGHSISWVPKTRFIDRKFYFQKLRTAPQPLQVIRPAKRFTAIDPQRLKQPVPILKASVKYRNHRLFFGHKLAIQKNNHALISIIDKRPVCY